MTSFDDLTAAMDAVIRATIMETIAWADDGQTYRDLRAFVAWPDAVLPLDGSKVIAQDVLVEIFVADVPVKPNGNCRLTSPKLQLTSYKPVNVRRDESGDMWRFELSRV